MNSLVGDLRIMETKIAALRKDNDSLFATVERITQTNVSIGSDALSGPLYMALYHDLLKHDFQLMVVPDLYNPGSNIEVVYYLGWGGDQILEPDAEARKEAVTREVVQSLERVYTQAGETLPPIYVRSVTANEEHDGLMPRGVSILFPKNR